MTDEPKPTDGTGLGNAPMSEWPVPPEPGTPAIDVLRPGSDIHMKVRDYLVKRIEESERKMSTFYPRWKAMEMKVQAYINLSDYEKMLDQMNKDAKPAQVVSISVPYAFATIATITTYLLHTFCGRKPILQVGSYKKEMIENARTMETLLQYHADHSRLIKWFFKFLQDTQVYGLGVMKIQWKIDKALRTVRKTIPTYNFFGMQSGGRPSVTRELRTIYAGNMIEAQDPFMFFPDPRVPLCEVNKRGEYVFWRSFEGKHTMKKKEALGLFKWVDQVKDSLPEPKWSSRDGGNLKAGGEAIPGRGLQQEGKLMNYYQLDQGTVDIIPRELGLSESNSIEKWLFTIANKDQIIQAIRFDSDHGMHPIAVAEPYELGYGFGNPGMSDYLSPLQDTISWLVNSHIYNVRAALNNMFVVDPSKIEMQDIRNPDAGKLIRLKRAAFGSDVNMAIKQFSVLDVTGTHMKDTELFMRLGQLLSGVTDNLMGLQSEGGRKTATEVRTSGEAAASRLAAQARIISGQAITDMTEQMTVNVQQYLDEEFYLMVVGMQGMETPLRISPEQLAGDFHYPIHDGTLPLDRVAMLDVWKEIFLGVAQDPQLRAQYDVPKLFEWVAELGGARNLSAMRVNVQTQPNAQVQDAAASGKVVPIGKGSLTAGAPV